MPAAALAKAEGAAYHSHTTAVGSRDDCSMGGRKVPGYGRTVISTGDPAFRFDGSRPERTMYGQTQ